MPTSQCSKECSLGYSQKYDGKCCFECEICPSGTSANKGKIVGIFKNNNKIIMWF